ncbi:MAG TPA: 5'-methylthioadenosine/S-adenosylhomocysteine nucleosidase [Paracoccus sp. (in: a-proteobacteria)]|nr:5'-methylthioadenosine/S-adenosylhomocysteine nucleosidase [Paracoccus sp. (in: a-proteobacteria)]
MPASGPDLPHLDHLAGRPVLFVMAARAEYGPALRARITPLMTGVGPVESGLAMGAALARLQGAGRLPAAVVSLGSAGSRDLEQGAVYQAQSVSYRDMDATALGFARGVTPFLDLPACIPLSPQVPGIPAATLSTGADIVSGVGYARAGAQMVDMESFAVCRACMNFGVPLIGLRGISDGAAPLTGMLDWTRYLDVIDRRLADAVAQVERAVADGLLD